jgi:hypothetical protein
MTIHTTQPASRERFSLLIIPVHHPIFPSRTRTEPALGPFRSPSQHHIPISPSQQREPTARRATHQQTDNQPRTLVPHRRPQHGQTKATPRVDSARSLAFPGRTTPTHQIPPLLSPPPATAHPPTQTNSNQQPPTPRQPKKITAPTSTTTTPSQQPPPSPYSD